MIKTWVIPSCVCVLVATLYLWFVAPIVRDVQDDWGFLHAARLSVIQQQLKQQQSAPPVKP